MILNNKFGDSHPSYRLSNYVKFANRMGYSTESEYRAFLNSDKPKYDFSNEAGEVDIFLRGPLDSMFGTNVNDLMQSIDDAKAETINLQITSPGGELYQGMNFYSYLKDKVEAGVELKTRAVGLAASAASLPFVAAKPENRSFSAASEIMIHRVMFFGLMDGNAGELKAQFEAIMSGIEKADRQIENIFINETDNNREEIGALLDAETFMDEEEAAENGFLDRGKKKRKNEFENVIAFEHGVDDDLKREHKNFLSSLSRV